MPEQIRAIALWQPWATLVACGAKTYETRAWQTGYRGLLAIHAAKTLDRAALREFRRSPHCPSELEAASLPLGAIVAVVRLADCSPVELVPDRYIGGPERLFGDWSGGRYAWKLEDLITLAEPVPHSGRQGLYELDERTAAAVRLRAGLR